MTAEELDLIYMEILGRHVDDSGKKVYQNIDPDEVRDILLKSPEYAHIHHQKENIDRYLKTYTKPAYKSYGSDKFDVVICRYGEDVSFIDYFSYYPCDVYLYNKGLPIERKFKGNVNIIECENIGYEDYVYLRHINNGIDRPVLFMQCHMEHCPELFYFLDSFEGFSGFESMSQGMGIRDPVTDNRYETDYGIYMGTNVSVLDVEEIMMIFSKSSTIKGFFKERYNVNIEDDKQFVPGAQFFLRPECLDTSVRFDVLLEDIKYAHTLGAYTSKKLASVFERYLWTNIVIKSEE